MMRYILPVVVLFLSACGGGGMREQEQERVYVSIAPLGFLARQIVGTGMQVEVLVPELSSPESYEPTPRQLRELSAATAYFSTGLLDFEQALEVSIKELAPNTAYCDLSRGLDLIRAEHEHGHEPEDEHQLGTDPHIWLSPSRMRTMGFRVAEVLGALRPDSAQVYAGRAADFARQVDSLDQYIRRQLAGAARHEIAIGHTALTYFSADYGLRQIAVEADGKEPGAASVKQLVDSLQRLGITAVFYQQQTSDVAARMVAAELRGGRAIRYDPLAEDWLGNMYRLADTLHVVLNP